MANLGGTYKRFVSAGCSHGSLIDKKAAKAFLKFCDDYQAQTRIHHGDWCDQTAFRSGAKGTPDERASISLDLSEGVRFVEDFRATHLLNGNHDIRVYRFANSTNAVEREAATRIINDMRDMTRKLDCKFMESYDVRKSWFEFGGTKFLHGWAYGVNAIRDNALTFGNCVHTHIHRLGSETAARVGGPVAHSAGYLANEDELDYGHARKQTLAHQQGFAFGHYNNTGCHVWLARIENGRIILPQMPRLAA